MGRGKGGPEKRENTSYTSDTTVKIKAKIFNMCWFGPALNAFYGSSDLNFLQWGIMLFLFG